MAWRWCGFRRRALGCKSLHGAVLVAFTRLIRYSSSPLGGCPLLPDLSFAARPQPHCAAAAELVTGSQPFKSHVKSKEIGFGAVQFFVTFTPPQKKNRLSKRIFGSKQDEHQSLGPLRALSDGHPNLPQGVLPPHLFAPICGSAEYHPNQFSGGRARQLDDGSITVTAAATASQSIPSLWYSSTPPAKQHNSNAYLTWHELQKERWRSPDAEEDEGASRAGDGRQET